MLITEGILEKVTRNGNQWIKDMSNDCDAKIKVIEFQPSTALDRNYIFEIDGDKQAKLETILNFMKVTKEEYIK